MRKVVIAAAVAAAAALGPAVPASAYVDGDYAGSGVAIRECQYTYCTRHGLGYPGQGARLFCFRFGTNINGNPYWDYHRNRQTGVTGYSADYYMNWYGSIPHC